MTPHTIILSVFTELTLAFAYSVIAFGLWQIRNEFLPKPILLTASILLGLRAICTMGDLVIDKGVSIYYIIFFLHIVSSALAFAVAWKFAELVVVLKARRKGDS